jgi:hypothetical protein
MAAVDDATAMLADVADLPFPVPPGSAATLLRAIDREGKIDRALEALGPIAGRDVVAVDPGPAQTDRWIAAGARLTAIPSVLDPDAMSLDASSADTVIGSWTTFRGVDAAELAAVDRILRPNGRLLVIHDYGRDDVSTMRGDRPEYGAWSRRDGPFLRGGFRVRVIHCFWTFDSLDEARTTLGEAFGDAAGPVIASLKRPRVSWNVAVYHRSRAGSAEDRIGDARTAGDALAAGDALTA